MSSAVAATDLIKTEVLLYYIHWNRRSIDLPGVQ